MGSVASAQVATAEGRDRMGRLDGESFTIWFEEPVDEGFSWGVMEALDRAYWRIGAVLQNYPLHIIPVVIHSAPTFREVTQLPGWSLGGYDGAIRISKRPELDNPVELDALVAHELTHAFVSALAPRGVPAWLGEGIATALAASDADWTDGALRAGPISINLLPANFAALAGADVPRAYATSALLARQLLRDAGGVGVANLLRDLGEGVELETALRRRTNRSVAELQRIIRDGN